MISLQAAGPGGGRPLAGVAVCDRRALLADARHPLLRCRQVGTVAAFVTGFCPTYDWLPATGTLLSIAQNSALYALFNTTYGEIHASPLHFPPALLRALRAAAGRLVHAAALCVCARPPEALPPAPVTMRRRQRGDQLCVALDRPGVLVPVGVMRRVLHRCDRHLSYAPVMSRRRCCHARQLAAGGYTRLSQRSDSTPPGGHDAAGAGGGRRPAFHTTRRALSPLRCT